MKLKKVGPLLIGMPLHMYTKNDIVEMYVQARVKKRHLLLSDQTLRKSGSDRININVSSETYSMRYGDD